MKKIELDPDQIITLKDYPVYSNNILCDYFSKCKQGKEVPFVPVIQKEIVREYFNDTLRKKLTKFEKSHPKANFFMLDGSHRTTALTLSGCKIMVVIYEKDEDIFEAKKMVGKGQICESETLNHTLKENCKILNIHFSEKPYFMTVEEKTTKMSKEKKVPQEITEYCTKS